MSLCLLLPHGPRQAKGANIIMKLLLTSSGLTNNSIVNALFELTEKKAEETSIVFIPTASNVELGDKGWLID
ncbi:MAG: hypothetical protein PHF26_03980, partial [Candidatus Gracilibacteria bacterium]|nr:hypothetical protein [Candidatus Gracilibacteria bacterium]